MLRYDPDLPLTMRRVLCVALTGALLLLADPDAAAYCRTTTCDPAQADCKQNDQGCIRDGVPLRWRVSPIPYRFSAVGSEKLNATGARAAIRRAFDAWANVECAKGRTSLRFSEQSDIRGAVPSRTRDLTTFGIYYRDDVWPHDDAEESIALTTQTYGKTTGYIDSVVMEINTANNAFALTDDEQGTDLQAVVTHEAGHYIGLAHSPNADSIMVARYCQPEASETSSRCTGGSDRRRALADDDIRAVCALYPPGGTSDADADPTATSAGCSTSAGAPEEACFVASAAFAILALVRRRRHA